VGGSVLPFTATKRPGKPHDPDSGSFLAGSGFWINHPGSGSMAGSDMYNLLNTVRDDQASNDPDSGTFLAWLDPDSRFIIPILDPWPDLTTCIIYCLPYVKTRQAKRSGFRNLFGLVGSGF